MFQTNLARKIKTHLIFCIFFPKIVRVGDSVGKYGTTAQATDENSLRNRKGAICMPENDAKYTDTLTHYLIYRHTHTLFNIQTHSHTI